MERLFVSLYVFVALALYYPVFLRLLDWMRVGDEDTADRAFAGFIGFFLVVVWPPIVVGYGAFRLSKALYQRTHQSKGEKSEDRRTA